MKFYRFTDSKKRLRIGKIICLARTYAEHAQEMHASVSENPVMFLKPDTTVIFSHDTVRFPRMSQCLHHEVELGIVIGKKGKHISEVDAMDHVLGYCIGLDITARDLQATAKKNGWPWGIPKGFDTFAPLSDVVMKEELPNPRSLALELKVNGVVKQYATPGEMIYSLEHIISFLSDVMTLEPGDLILTGTPAGVGEIKEGDVLEARLGTVCSLTVDVKKET
ncbi:MAG TPA: fumarylacetoacetate hydrolase family protein [Candidatus Thermoplasmatota archaeon]|nr:fumarylacetoacetate hydrolase family protein [Candidatus Thermoplasmatota archaeon]